MRHMSCTVKGLYKCLQLKTSFNGYNHISFNVVFDSPYPFVSPLGCAFASYYLRLRLAVADEFILAQPLLLLAKIGLNKQRQGTKTEILSKIKIASFVTKCLPGCNARQSKVNRHTEVFLYQV